MPENTLQMPLLVICDLRHVEGDFRWDERLYNLIEQASDGLVGKTLEFARPVEVMVPKVGAVHFWAAGQQKATTIRPETPMQIVDVLRKPAKRYVCKVCGEYGPLRCKGCIDEEVKDGTERICTKCAYFVGDSLEAYCPRHLPECQCSKQCQHKANFVCSSCYAHKKYMQGPKKLGHAYFYHEHVLRKHPNDKEIKLCNSCFNRSFNPCPICAREKKPGTARLQCAFKTLQKRDGCGEARCWGHTYQWKVWGPQSAGITLCERHQPVIASASPVDLLLTLLTARPPQPRYFNHNTDISRMRRLLNRDRPRPLTFEELEHALQLLAPLVSVWNEYDRARYEKLIASSGQRKKDLQQAQPQLDRQIRQFYRQLNPTLERQIRGIEIVDRFQDRISKETKFEVNVYIQSDSPGPFIGKGGAYSKQVEADYHAKLKFWFSDGKNARAF